MAFKELQICRRSSSRAQRRARVAWNEPGRIEGASFSTSPTIARATAPRTSAWTRARLTASLFSRAASSPRARGFFRGPGRVHPSPHRELTRRVPRRSPLILESPTQIIARASVYLTDSYKKCNPGFEYASHLNPRRMLTKPSKPAGNGGHDNENQELIISVNDVLRADGGGGSEFEVRDTLGSGTFGQVVRCREKGTGRQAAVKVIKNHPAYFHQAHVEIGILHMLNTKCDESDQHHIVRMLDHFVHRSHLCIVFEVLNVNLYELLRQNNFRGLSTKLVRTFTRQLLVALRMLRNANVIHCDLKPENILVKSLETGEIKLIDFGSACFENRTVYQYIQSRFYRSPEVVLGSPYGMPIDMWSLGCVVAELFLGLPLFPGASEYNLLSRISETLGPPPASMLSVASNTHKFFRQTEGGAQSGGLSAAMHSGDADAGATFRLMTLDEYETKSGKRAAMGKKYFKYTLLEDIVQKAALPSGLDDAAIAKERADRASLLDFLRGLLRSNPFERWTPDQAIPHPFVTDAPFTAPFTPNPPEEISAAVEERARGNNPRRARAAKVAKQGQTAAAAAAQNEGTTAAPPRRRWTRVGAPHPRNPARRLPRRRVDSQPRSPPSRPTRSSRCSSSCSNRRWRSRRWRRSSSSSSSASPGSDPLPVRWRRRRRCPPVERRRASEPREATGRPGVGGLPFGMSPHALNSAALHPLHFGQSPPTQHVSAMGFAAGMQHAAAAAAAAAVQLPALNPQFASSPAGPGLNLAAGFVGRQNFAANQPGAFAGPASAHGGGWGGSQGPASTFDSLTRARPSHLRSVGEEGNGEMEHDGGGRASGASQGGAGGMGERKRSMEQLSDHEAWDDELLFEADGVGGGGGVASTSGSGAGGLSVGATGTAPGATTSGVGGGWPSKGAHVAGTPPTSAGMFSQSVPNWHSAGMMGHQPPQLQFQAQAANAAAMANNFQALAQFGSPQQQAHLAQQFQHQVGLNPMSSQQRQLAVQMQLQQHQQQMYGGSPQREIPGQPPAQRRKSSDGRR